MDDDSGEGIYTIKEICDRVGMKAIFAVIPSRLDERKRDSLRAWQHEGFSIALHGLNHDRWSNWAYRDVVDDIEKSEKTLREWGYEMNIQYVVPPYGCNNRNIRKAIEDKGYKMITGASIANQDPEKFQQGRIWITKSTDVQEIGNMLQQAYKKRAYIIFGTHSSIAEEFSTEKTEDILRMAIKMGFKH